MARSVAWAYGAAGAVVAAAVIVVAGSTVGLTEGAADGARAPAFSSGTLPAAVGENVVSSEVVTTSSGEQVEYVYVDQPASRGEHDDDDDRGEHDDDDDHEEREREHEDHDDDEDDD